MDKQLIKNKFTVYDSEEKTALELIQELYDRINKGAFIYNNPSNVNENISFKLFADIPYIGDYNVAQGSCVTDKYILLAACKKDDSDSMITVLDKETFEVLNRFTGKFHHANTLSYDYDNKKIIITHCISNGDPQNSITIIEEDELLKTYPLYCSKSIERFNQVQSVAYYKGNYYINSTDEQDKIFILDKDFKTIGSWKTKNNSIVQGIEIFNDTMFITRINLGSGFISEELVDAFSSVIEVYTLDGLYIRSYIINGVTEGNEIESFYNYDNGTFLSTWKGFNSTLIMKSRVYENYYYNAVEIDKVYAWQSAQMTLYINKNYNNVICDGTEDKPYKSISQAMKYVYANPNVNDVVLNIIGDFSNENIHLKNKHFTINCIDGAKIKGVVGKNSSIRLNDVNIKSDGRALNIDGCNVMINGTCYISSTGENTVHSTNSKIYVSGTSLTLIDKPMFLSNTDMSINCNLILSNVNNVTVRGSNLRYTVSLSNDLLDKIVMERGSTVFTSGYNNINYSSNFTGYSSSYNTARLSMNGNQVTLNGIMKPTSAIAGGTEKHLICTLPSNLNPPSEHNFICHGSSRNKYMVTIETNGNVNFSRYTDNSEYIETPTSAWLPYSITYTL